ncbi:hypothetical protein KGF57_001100 [Candida theae]|uniref:Uncharacterized protein n=1 Tax=Candida theae TaxID=1198502 RepID=A0AAD5BHQ5_9ASCO|nr:uncharacterized protein KGF57_001100 [Candida theae]KAI5964426.1 hypothetical protein KGF57_001100 [Candida theae]
MIQSSNIIRNTAIRLSLLLRRHVSTRVLPRYQQIYSNPTPSFLNHFTFIDNLTQTHSFQKDEPRLRAQRDSSNILQRVSSAPSDASYRQHVQSLINYVDPVKFSNEELACISNGLTNLELRIENDEGHVSFIETDRLRRLGKTTFQLALVNQFRIFQNVGFLSYSETDIESDLAWLLNDETIVEFMKLNGLANCVAMNRELLINENLARFEFETKKKMVFSATAIGSFFTLVGLMQFKPRPGSSELMDKIINGKRGVFGILKQSA